MTKTIYEKEEAKGLYGPKISFNAFEIGQLMALLIRDDRIKTLDKGLQRKLNKYLEKIYSKTNQ